MKNWQQTKEEKTRCKTINKEYLKALNRKLKRNADRYKIKNDK